MRFKIILNIDNRLVEEYDKLRALQRLRGKTKYPLTTANASAFFLTYNIVTWNFPTKYKNKIISIELDGRLYNKDGVVNAK